MKTMILAAMLLFTAFSLLAMAADEKPAGEGKGSLYHVVSFKFKADADKAKIQEVEQAFAALKEKIPGITSLAWGTNVSPEKHDKGFTHCFILTYANEQDRDAYLVHPAHDEFVKLVGPIVEDVFVVDFWSDEAPVK